MDINPLFSLIKKTTKLIIYLIIAAIALWFFYTIFDQIGLTIDVYGYYLMWIVAMGIFYLTLPKHNTSSVFSKSI